MLVKWKKAIWILPLLIGCGSTNAVASVSDDSVSAVQEEQSVEEETASEMKLEQLEGTVGVDDGTSVIDSFAGMNLYNGYSVETEDQSFSWINLDQTKLLKMDEESLTRISQENKNLKITLDEGNLFFCVTEPLAEDEVLEFETTNMTLSIRGTTGIIRQEKEMTTVIMLEGEGTIYFDNTQEQAIGGKAYEIFSPEADERTIQFESSMSGSENGYHCVERDIYQGGDVTDFVIEELENNQMVKAKTDSLNISMDYFSDDEIAEIAASFEGHYEFKGMTGTGKSEDDSLDINVNDPYLLDIQYGEDGTLTVELTEKDDIYEMIEEYNERMIATGHDHLHFDHMEGLFNSKYIRLADENTLRFPYFPYEMLKKQEDGNLAYSDSAYYHYEKSE